MVGLWKDKKKVRKGRGEGRTVGAKEGKDPDKEGMEQRSEEEWRKRSIKRGSN